MADINQTQQQQQQPQCGDVVEVIEALNQTVPLTTSGEVAQTEVEEVSADLLQQALGVAVSSFQQETVEYAGVDGVVSIVEENDGEVTAMVASVDDADSEVATLVDEVQTVDGTTFEAAEYGVCIDGSVSAEQIEELTNNAEELCQNEMIVSDSAEGLEVPSEQSEVATVADSTQVYSVQTSESGPGEGLRVTLVPSNAQSGAPLGSSQNPIRIIQQGNQYTPVQHLSSDQLSQIMQVVQQQQLAKTTQDGGGSSTLFNPDTNTRIVYRVIYPSELHKNASTDTSTQVTQSQGQSTVLQKRTYRKRRLDEDDDDKTDTPELSREEKEARKKHRPRTRSGRVSKPPKHMVKDYKHIHPLDWDEDPYDDSDGGYSDFKYSEDERARDNEDSNDVDFAAGLSLSRPKKWKCASCEKSYIGRGGLSRHYMLNPDHGKDSDLPLEPGQLEDEKKRASLNDSTYQVSNGLGFSGNFSEDSNTQDSLPTSTVNSNNNSTATSNSTSTVPAKRGRGWPKGLSRSEALYRNSSMKRKRKLKEFLKICTDEELMEQVLPRLSKVITLWEFLLMRVETGSPARPQVAEAYREFEGLHKKVQSMCQKYLRPMSNTHQEIDPATQLQIDDADVANSLGLEVGMYCVKTIDNADESFHTALRMQKSVDVTHSHKQEGPPRMVEVTSRDVTGNSTKHIVINPPASMTSAAPKAQLLRVSGAPIITNTVHAQTVSTSLVNGQSLKPAAVSVPKPRDFSSGVSVSQTSLVVSQPQVVKKTSLLHSQNRLVTTNPPGFQANHSSLRSSPNISSVNSPSTISFQAAKPILQTVQTTPQLPNHYTSSSNLPHSGSSTQITIPVVLPQGTEQISLELPSSLAESILDNGITLNQTVTSSEEDLATTSTTPSNIVPVCDGSSLLLNPAITSQSLISQQTDAAADVNTVPVQTDESQIVQLQCFGDVQLPRQIDTSGMTQYVQQEGEVTALENGTEDQLVEGQIISGSNLFQTEDGIIIVQNPDGTTLQLQGAQGLSLETVQALLAMDTDGQAEKPGEITQLTDFS